MKKKYPSLRIAKKQMAFFIILLFATSSIMFSQSASDFNLPPGAKFMIKKYERIDYSYKLNGAYSNESLNKNYLFKFTEEEFNNLKKKNKETYLYYQTANNYFIKLSDKVKKAFTVNELWYIYIYDANLKNKLPNIK